MADKILTTVEFLGKLAEPFDPAQVHWKPQAINKEETRALKEPPQWVPCRCNPHARGEPNLMLTEADRKAPGRWQRLTRLRLSDATYTGGATRPQEDTMTDWRETWLSLGNRNSWICLAVDPPFTLDSFRECKDDAELTDYLGGERCMSWALGSAFYVGDLCFIQQVNGGDEWLVLRRGLAFESLSARHVIELGEFDAWLARVRAATDQQLRELRY